MRWHILRTLISKELRRLAADRGIILLGCVLVCMGVLLSLFGKRASEGLGLGPGGNGKCIIDFWEDGPWVEHLRRNVPTEWRQENRLVFRNASQAIAIHGVIQYSQGQSAIQIRPQHSKGRSHRFLAWFWYPAGDPASLAPFEAWFWKETRAFGDFNLAASLEKNSPGSSQPLPFLYIKDLHTPVAGGTLDLRGRIATGLVIFSLFFTCVYLLPSMTCEERERGVLLAQMLSPVSAAEFMAAKFVTYPLLGVAMAALLAGLYRPTVLADHYFWFALMVTAFGSVGIGLSIASLAQTQRLASMGSLCYLLMLAMLTVIVVLNDIPILPYLAIEYYEARILNAALSGEVFGYHYVDLIAAMGLSFAWAVLATCLFRRWGWQ
jgi:ABC-type transport system involved in cytochrome c biogenesis permease component